MPRPAQGSSEAWDDSGTVMTLAKKVSRRAGRVVPEDEPDKVVYIKVPVNKNQTREYWKNKGFIFTDESRVNAAQYEEMREQIRAEELAKIKAEMAADEDAKTLEAVDEPEPKTETEPKRTMGKPIKRK